MNPNRLLLLFSLMVAGCSAKLGEYVSEEPLEAGATISGETVVDNADGRTDADADADADADTDADADADVGTDVGTEDTGPTAEEEICDGLDNDGDGEVDEGLVIDFFYDRDGDGWGGANDTGCTLPADAVLTSGDCDDEDASIHPDAEELCNEVDDNCNLEIDEGLARSYFADFDGDGFGSPFEMLDACDMPDGYVDNDQDCNDASELISPDNPEVCNGTDDNCDGEIDEGVLLALYPDADGDGFGMLGEAEPSCLLMPGFSTESGDCDDEDETVNPDAEEICDGRDNDCDGGMDDTTESTPTVFWLDADGDGYGAGDSLLGCDIPDGHTGNGADCNDDNPDINPDAEEACDGLDNDCDGETDEDLALVVYPDADGDGFGFTDAPETVCEMLPDFTTVSGDCNDDNPDINPDATEICDGLDNDCDGGTDDTDDAEPVVYWLDSDGDGFGAGGDITGCELPTGYVTNNTDCDDTTAARSPDSEEICDEIDNDCDGDVDESLTIAVYPDGDGDGFGRSIDVERRCSVVEGFTEVPGDCDDADAAISPDGVEVCNSKDDNCDGTIDNDATGGLVAHYRDADGDGHGTGEAAFFCTAPTGFVLLEGDCDDDNAALSPSSTETCNGVDDNCDGAIDEGVLLTFYDDADADGFGTTPFSACERPAGTALVDGDCNDASAEINPDAPELCDGTDNDCNGAIDDDPIDGTPWFSDIDEDGFGDPFDVTYACGASPDGFVADNTDCEPTDAEINPDADEICNEKDDDCDTEIDEAAVDSLPWYIDEDDDGFGTPSDPVVACDPPDGYVDNDGDCADDDPSISPAAVEVCDEIDNDCNDTIDDDALDTIPSYVDADEDGFGSSATDAVWVCEADLTTGWSRNNFDCNDGQALINPDGVERCNGQDDDCDGDIDEEATDRVDAYADDDKDGYGAGTGTVLLCEVTEGWSLVNTDCDDANPNTNPGATEYCNGTDNDCDGVADEGAADRFTIYLDDDDDGYGTAAVSELTCSGREGWTAVAGDCRDDDPNTNPGATEYCNGIDNDCDGIEDDEAVDRFTIYLDSDDDGYGTSAVSDLACGVRAGWTTTVGDCDDEDDDIRPGVAETCDGFDENCDGVVDEGATDCPCTQRNYGTHSYWFCDNRSKRWNNAQNWCDARNYDLVTVNNADEQEWLKNLLLYDGSIDNEPYWIGLNDRDRENTFVWASGESSSYRAWSWRWSQPDDYGDEDCVEINRWGDPEWWSDWNDLECDDSQRYICEASP